MTRPSPDLRTHVYFVAYNWLNHGTGRFGTAATEITQSGPITTFENVVQIKRVIERDPECDSVAVINWILLRVEPTTHGAVTQVGAPR